MSGECANACRYGQTPLQSMIEKLAQMGADKVCNSYAAAVVQSAPSECIDQFLAGTSLDLSACSFQLQFPQCHYHGWPTASIAFVAALCSLAVILPATMVFYATAKSV